MSYRTAAASIAGRIAAAGNLRAQQARGFLLRRGFFPPAAAACDKQALPRARGGSNDRSIRHPLSSSSLRASGFRRAEEGAMKTAEDATPCPEIPRRCHHCAGPLSKDMVNPRPQIASSLLSMTLSLPAGSPCLCGNPSVCFV